MVPSSAGKAPQPAAGLLSRASDAGLCFEGFLSVAADGLYTLQLESDTGSSLWLHEGLAIDNDVDFAPVRSSAPLNLAAGLHPIRIHYRHRDGAANLVLKYSGPGIPLQTVPASAFVSEGPPPVANPDTFTTNRNTGQLADVLANDSSIVPLSLASAGPSILGATTVVSNKLQFTPTAGVLGYSEFPYIASNGSQSVPGQVSATVLFSDEVWFPFEEGSGAAVSSRGGSPEVTGAFAGITDPALAWVPGRFGSGLEFDGVDDQVDFPDLVLPTGKADRTFSCWLKTSSRAAPEQQVIFSYGSNNFGKRFLVRLNNVANVASDQPAQLDVTGGYVRGSTPLNDGVWHHLAITVADHNGDGVVNVNEAKIFVDGMLEAVAAKSGEVINTGSNLVPAVGGSNHNSNFNYSGRIDDLRIFPTALSDAEVAALYQTVPWYLNPPPPSGDSDGDGMSDDDEALAGTDPNDSESVFKFDGFTMDQGQVMFNWTGFPGRDYQLEQSTDLVNWVPVPGQGPVSMGPPASPGSPIVSPFLSLNFPQSAPGPLFYRLRVSLTPP